MASNGSAKWWRALAWVVFWIKRPLDVLERWIVVRWARAESRTLRVRAEQARNGG